MRFLTALTLSALLSAGALANTRYVLRYTESPPLSSFLTQYGLQLRQSVPGRPIFSVVDPQNRNSDALIQQISDDTDDDVSIERDQILYLPILSYPVRQTSAMDLLQAAMNRLTQVKFYYSGIPYGARHQYAVNQTRANLSWRSHGLGTGIVAVIDTGVDPSHPFLAGSLEPGIDLLTANGNASELQGLTPAVMALINPTTTPLLRTKISHLSNGTAPNFPANYTSLASYSQIPIGLGHGTMVAGAVRLVAPGARILPVRAFAQTGAGRLYDVIQGMHMAEDRGAKVINMSLNTYAFSPELARSCDEIASRGVMLIASTGNNGLTQVPSYPASNPKVTGVAALTPAGTRSLFSNAGSNLTWVAAPGEGLMLPFPGNRWAGGWGTSFSAPLVSGLAAKILVAKPTATYSDLQSALGRSAPLPDPNLGEGSLDVFNSMLGL